MSVLAAAGDAGGARALEGVIRRLRARSDLRVSCAAYAAALDLWRVAGFSPQDIEPVDVSGFERVILGTSVSPEQWELEVVRRAREQRVPTVSVLDFWSHYWERFTASDGTRVLPDAILVMDEHARAEMIAAGFPADRLHVTGHPAVDELVRYDEPARRADARARVRAIGGCADGDLPILYVSQPLSQLGSRAEFGFDERDVFPALTASVGRVLQRRSRRGALLVKLHPREAGQPFPAPVGVPSCLSVRIIDDAASDPRELVVGSDLVVGMNSVLLLDACMLRQPVVSYQPNLRGSDLLPSNRHGWSRAVYDPRLLDDTIDSELFDPVTARSRARRLSQIAVSVSATDRVIDALDVATIPPVTT